MHSAYNNGKNIIQALYKTATLFNKFIGILYQESQQTIRKMPYKATAKKCPIKVIGWGRIPARRLTGVSTHRPPSLKYSKQAF